MLILWILDCLTLLKNQQRLSLSQWVWILKVRHADYFCHTLVIYKLKPTCQIVLSIQATIDSTSHSVQMLLTLNFLHHLENKECRHNKSLLWQNFQIIKAAHTKIRIFITCVMIVNPDLDAHLWYSDHLLCLNSLYVFYERRTGTFVEIPVCNESGP